MPRSTSRRPLGETYRPCLSSAPKSRSMPSSATLATNGDSGPPCGTPVVVGFHTQLHRASFQPASDGGGEHRQSRQQGLVPKIVEAAGNVRIEQPCPCTRLSQ